MESTPIATHKTELEQLFVHPFKLTNYLCHWSEKHKYIYVETPKVACTTVKRVLQAAEKGILEAPKKYNVHDRTASPLLAPQDDIGSFLNALRSTEYRRFCFVRNPYTRILSCYLEKMVQNPLERKRLAPMLGLDPSTPPSFINFLTAISEQRDEERDIHWAPQTYLLRPNRIQYSFVGRFELFREQLRLVCRVLSISQYATDLPDTDHATSAQDSAKELLRPLESELIRKIYERDFTNYAYGWSPDFV